MFMNSVDTKLISAQNCVKHPGKFYKMVKSQNLLLCLSYNKEFLM